MLHILHQNKNVLIVNIYNSITVFEVTCIHLVYTNLIADAGAYSAIRGRTCWKIASINLSHKNVENTTEYN